MFHKYWKLTVLLKQVSSNVVKYFLCAQCMQAVLCQCVGVKLDNESDSSDCGLCVYLSCISLNCLDIIYVDMFIT